MRVPLAIGALVTAAALLGAAPPTGGPVFVDVTGRAGIAFHHSYGDVELDNIVEGTGSGACVFDYDGDGWLDIYLPNGRWEKNVSSNRGRSLQGQLENALYHNNRDGTFSDVTDKAGVGGKAWGFGCSAADYDNDGHVDLYVLNYGANELYHNDGDGTFTDATERSGLGDSHWSLNAPWLDYDGDGFLDVFVCNYLLYDDGKFRAYYAAQGYPGPLSYSGQPSSLFRNNRDGTFTDVTKAAGVFNPDGRCMSAVAADLNDDGRLDIYQANDAMESYYYEKQPDGTFKEKGLPMGLAFGQHGQGVSHMGPFVGDVDGDGRLDLFVPDLDYGSLLMNRGGFFADAIDQSGLAVITGQYTGWGGVLFDYDNDGWPDAFMATGNAHHEYPEDPVLARNDGRGGFVDVARESGEFFQKKYVARGATWADFDNDGNVDLLVLELNGPPHLLRNGGGTGSHWLKVDARVAGGTRTAIGARVTATTGERRQVQDVIGVNGYLSQGDARVHLGVGDATKVDRLEIRWPDGRTRELKDVPVDKVLRVDEEPR
jgi:enediyne biosynthesis protein E4